VTVDATDTGWVTTGLMTADAAPHMVIDRGYHGTWMAGVDAEKLGNVGPMPMSHPEPETFCRATQYDPSLIEAFFGMAETDQMS
jgi:hypothetical protein